ncbi:transcription factor e2f2 [Limosa lapponica baueri]|uniref:Transcription factor e2f2 n=1 Tax=Limosa lapponica baueri TaxID=1758121 RepID=A0A2I0SZD6_LIMLA|nr:transcription factor e2f2 [Limosa lapponica baueri]
MKQQALRGELAELARMERTLDQVLQDCDLQLRQLDLRAISNFQEQTVIAVKAPPETQMEVPDFSEVRGGLGLGTTFGST